MPHLLPHRTVLHVADGLREVVDTADVYLLEADGGNTRIHVRERGALRDVRALGEVLSRFESRGFLRVHRSYVVNLARVRWIRRRARGRDWEVELEAPVPRTLPISREAYPLLVAVLEGEG